MLYNKICSTYHWNELNIEYSGSIHGMRINIFHILSSVGLYGASFSKWCMGVLYIEEPNKL